MKKKTIVVHSGGMDSTLCLYLACLEFGHENVLSLSFSYQQRHTIELEQAKKICKEWSVDHTVLSIDCLKLITNNSLMDSSIPLSNSSQDSIPSTLVVGRNGLMAHLAGIHAHQLGAQSIYMGVMELEVANSGYRDCSRVYMDLQEQILKIDLDNPEFEIRTPLVFMTKKETLDIGFKLGVLPYLLKETITCYEGVPHKGCARCAACLLRNEAIREFLLEHPAFEMPY